MIIQLSQFGRNELKNANSHARTELRRSQKCSLWKIDWTEMTSQGLQNSAGSPLGKKKKGKSLILKERRKGHLFARTSEEFLSVIPPSTVRCKVRSECSILLWIECLPKLLPLFFWTTLVLLNQLKAGLFFLDFEWKDPLCNHRRTLVYSRLFPQVLFSAAASEIHDYWTNDKIDRSSSRWSVFLSPSYP